MSPNLPVLLVPPPLLLVTLPVPLLDSTQLKQLVLSVELEPALAPIVPYQLLVSLDTIYQELPALLSQPVL